MERRKQWTPKVRRPKDDGHVKRLRIPAKGEKEKKRRISKRKAKTSAAFYSHSQSGAADGEKNFAIRYGPLPRRRLGGAHVNYVGGRFSVRKGLLFEWHYYSVLRF